MTLNWYSWPGIRSSPVSNMLLLAKASPLVPSKKYQLALLVALSAVTPMIHELLAVVPCWAESSAKKWMRSLKLLLKSPGDRGQSKARAILAAVVPQHADERVTALDGL